jgi:hypothetical protein
MARADAGLVDETFAGLSADLQHYPQEKIRLDVSKS